MTAAHPPLLVFADDWGRHPSSCQHLIGRLLGRYEVYWVNTIMRPPRLDLSTLRRGVGKLGGWLRRARAAAADNPRVLSPKMWPWFGSAFSRRLNRRLLGGRLAALVKTLPRPPIAITTLPIVADVMDDFPVERWVYYCVDDFSEWPGLDKATLQQMEAPLVRRADVVLAVSETLQQKLAEMGKAAHLLTHGVDLEHWTSPDDERFLLPELERLSRPLVMFWGVIDRRMDVDFVRRLAEDLSAGTIVLVGPESAPAPALFTLPRVVRLPAMPFAALPALARLAAVLIMPYTDSPVTRAIQPLKLKEYLATGKPAVVRDLPAVRPWADCLDVAQTPESFSRAVHRRLQEGLPEAQQRARQRLQEESWSGKANAFERWALTTDAGPASSPAT